MSLSSHELEIVRMLLGGHSLARICTAPDREIKSQVRGGQSGVGGRSLWTAFRFTRIGIEVWDESDWRDDPCDRAIRWRQITDHGARH
jgi:hypothetical protein